MKDLEPNEFILWYLEEQGYDKTLKRLKESLKVKSEISKKKIKKFEKIKDEIIVVSKPKEQLFIVLIRYYKK